jgi:hypothetical protein
MLTEKNVETTTCYWLGRLLIAKSKERVCFYTKHIFGIYADAKKKEVVK